ncbi:MAG TPA: hypothetical protein VN709_07735 [Terriglobales bacterium]|nr:hypothetical protein [Terriglobales bacterium]
MTTRTMADGKVEREHALQQALTAWIITGLFFMLLPGTFLGVWNLIGISNGETMMAISPAWLQAHGHAQVFGWVGSFILGIGYYSLNKMAGRVPAGARAAWLSWALWTFGVGLRWWANITLHAWREALPVSGLAELTAFMIFFRTVARHKPAGAAEPAQPRPIWMKLVLLATLGFAAALLDNLGLAIRTALVSSTPAVAAPADQLFLTLVLWSFLVPLIWGFNARWLPVFLGLPEPSARGLVAAWLMALGAVLAALLADAWLHSGILAMAASVTAGLALHIPRRSERPPKTAGVHASFPFFARLPYAWLLVASALSILAPLADRAGGIWGASRHALTVGFVAAMVLVIGQRVLPAFCGMRVLFSQRLMFWSLALLNLGCLSRVGSEPLAYEGIWHAGWLVLPVSGMLELSGIVLFAANMFLTLARPPEHLRLHPIRPLASRLS